MNRFKNGKISPLMLIFGIIIFGALAVTVVNQIQQNNKLKVYNHEDNMNIVDTATSGDTIVETYTIAYDDALFSLGIPNGWEKVKKDGLDYYIHTPSATSVSIEIQPYDPSVNNENESTLSMDVTNKGYDFVSFQKKSSSSYEVIYQEQQNSLYDYIDEVIWSRDHIVTLHFIVKDENFSKMSPSLDTIYNSFNWYKDANIIPNNIAIWYIEYGDFEFALPVDWNVGTENGNIYATNPDNTAQLVVSITDNTSSLSDITSYDVTSMLQPSRSNGFMLQSFQNDINNASASAQYYNADGTVMENRTYLHANGFILYNFQFDYISGALDNDYTNILNSYFKEYYLEHNKEQLEATSNDAEEIDNASNTDAE